MLESDDLSLWCALNRLMSDYWADVDEAGGRQAHEFYLHDGLLAIGNNRFEGKEKIAAFYDRRRHSAVLTRHLLSNLRVFADDDARARVVGLMSLYRADGKSAFQGARPPAMIADFEARVIRDGDGQWLFISHVLRPFIVGSDLPASITIDPRKL